MSKRKLMPYKQLIESFRKGREEMMRKQGPITDEMIDALNKSRKYATK